jgi:hypothetical protein
MNIAKTINVITTETKKINIFATLGDIIIGIFCCLYSLHMLDICRELCFTIIAI